MTKGSFPLNSVWLNNWGQLESRQTGTPVNIDPWEDFFYPSDGGTFTVDAWISDVNTGSFTADAYTSVTDLNTFTADAYVSVTDLNTFTADAHISDVNAGTFTADTWLKGVSSGSFTADTWVGVSRTGSFSADVWVARTRLATFVADATISATRTGTATADAYIKRAGLGATFSADAWLASASATTYSGSFTANAWLSKIASGSLTADAYVKKSDLAGSFTANSTVSVAHPGSFTVDAIVKKTIASDYRSGVMATSPDGYWRLGGSPLYRPACGQFALYTDGGGYASTQVAGWYGMVGADGEWTQNFSPGPGVYWLLLYPGAPHDWVTAARLMTTPLDLTTNSQHVNLTYTGTGLVTVSVIPGAAGSNLSGTLFPINPAVMDETGAQSYPSTQGNVHFYDETGVTWLDYTAIAADGTFSKVMSARTYSLLINGLPVGYGDTRVGTPSLVVIDATTNSQSAVVSINLGTNGQTAHSVGVTQGSSGHTISGTVLLHPGHDGYYVDAPTLGATGLLTGDSDTAMSTVRGTLAYAAVPVSIPAGANPWSISLWYINDPTAGVWWSMFTEPNGPGLLSFIGVDNANITPLNDYIARGTDGQRHHLVWTYDGTAIRYYLDGALSANPGYGPWYNPHTWTGLASPVTELRLAGGHSWAGQFQGTVDEPAIWYRALSAGEVSTLYAKGVTGLAFTADATISVARAGSLTADSYIRSTQSRTFTADTFVQKTTSGTFTANANVLRASSGSWTADSWIKGTPGSTFTANAAVSKAGISGSFTADGYVIHGSNGAFTSDAWIKGTPSAAFSADAYVKKADLSAAFTANAYLGRTANSGFTADSWLGGPRFGSFVTDSWLKGVKSGQFTANAWIVALGTVSGGFTADSFVYRSWSRTFVADANISRTSGSTFTADGWLKGSLFGTLTANSWLRGILASQFTADAHIQGAISSSFTATANIRKISSSQFTADALIRGSVSSAFDVDSWISNPNAVKVVLGHATKGIMFRTMQSKVVGYEGQTSKTVVAVATNPTLGATLDTSTNIAGPNLRTEPEKM